jgi:NADH dehydrogenase
MTTRPRVVILGGGFGGLHAARALRRAPVDVVLVDRTNHHLFQPLLYQVATASLAPSDITVPIRWVLKRQRNATVLLGRAERVDPARKVVHFANELGTLPYDFLVVATGARHSYFGNSHWEESAPGLKSLEDALEVRRRFLLAFEHAELVTDAEARRALLTFVIVGGGPTGVELAGMLPDVARAMRRDFRRIDPTTARVILIEGGDRVLPGYPPALAARALHDLRELGVEVRLDTMVTDVDPRGVWLGRTFLPARTVLWAAGNAASPLGASLGAPLDGVGRVEVLPDLSVPGHPEIFVIGDLAAVAQPGGRDVPGVAQGAIQAGKHAARNIEATLRGAPRTPFRYRDLGDLATIGRHRAVANLPFLRFAGTLAWVFWLFLHLMLLVGFRNRLTVLVQWAYMYWTYQRGVRLITGGEDRAPPFTGEREVVRTGTPA